MYEQMQRLNRRFKVACDYVDEKYPDLHLFLGNEIMCHSDASESLSAKRCHFLGDTSYALVEFDPDASAYEIESSILKLLRKGIRPLIAHVERYSAIVKDFSFAQALKDYGALFQVNARSISNFKFGRIAKFLKLAFKKSLIDVVASDAHNASSFPPQLSKAYEIIVKHYGYEYANSIFHSKPLAILMNEQIL
jgi:protein-tyrosine phosphatase